MRHGLGGKRSATPLLHARNGLENKDAIVCPKAVSALRSATAVHDDSIPFALIREIRGLVFIRVHPWLNCSF
jgi:hypothetical protein